MKLFRSNSGQGGESLLLNFAAGSVFHTNWQAGESTYIAAESCGPVVAAFLGV